MFDHTRTNMANPVAAGTLQFYSMNARKTRKHLFVTAHPDVLQQLIYTKLFVNTPLFVLVTIPGYMFRSHGPSSGL